MYAWSNPPQSFWRSEIARFPDWLVWHQHLPAWKFTASACSLGDDTYRVRLQIWSNVSYAKSLREKSCEAVSVEFEPVGAL